MKVKPREYREIVPGWKVLMTRQVEIDAESEYLSWNSLRRARWEYARSFGSNPQELSCNPTTADDIVCLEGIFLDSDLSVTIMGMKLKIDFLIPRDEIRFVRDGEIVGRIFNFGVSVNA